MIAAGKYSKPLITAVNFGETSNGNDVVTIAFDIEGETVYYNGFLTEKAAEYALEALRNAGLEGDDILQAEKSVDEGGLVGARPFQVVVVHDEYEGKTRAVVRFINSELRGFEPMKEDRKKAVRERMRAKLAASAKKTQDSEAPFPA